MITTIKSILNKLPYIRTLHSENKNLKKNAKFPAGHFYSPIVSLEAVKEKEEEIWQAERIQEPYGIELEIESQKQLLKDFSTYYDELPFEKTKSDGLRYYYENNFYSYTDAIVLYSMIRHFKPKRIFEIGSGFSSSVMMDSNQRFFNNSIELVFIEPYPERLYSLMREDDKQSIMVIEDCIQNVDLSLYKNLKKNDMLFIDSSHIVKTGSDVNFILFKILPQLKPGVLVHFHDIFYPFEYPKKWVFGGFNWNEAYFVRAFLMYNSSFKITLFSDYMHKNHKEVFEAMPLTKLNTGGNLWIEKL